LLKCHSQIRKRGWRLKEIWINEDEGLGFSPASWSKNTGRFFKRIFKNDQKVNEKLGSFAKRVEETYKSK